MEEAIRTIEPPPISQEDLKRAEDKAAINSKSLGKVLDDLKTMFGMMKGHAKGDIRLPRAVIFGIAGAILYFLSPIDAVPDAIPVAGLLDDIAVVVATVSSLKSWIDMFRDGSLLRRADHD